MESRQLKKVYIERVSIMVLRTSHLYNRDQTYAKLDACEVEDFNGLKKG